MLHAPLSLSVLVHPGPLRGAVIAPPSKSVMQRVLAILLLRHASLVIHHPGDSADDRVLKRILLDAGFEMADDERGSLHILAPQSGQYKTEDVYFGESGLAARMLAPILALQDRAITLNAAPALCARPMHFIRDVLPQLGVRVVLNKGFLPATIHGPLQPRDITLDASLSSQFLSGLLMAYAAKAGSSVFVKVTNLASKPYIDLTLHIMQTLGMPVPKREECDTFHFPAERAFRPVPKEFYVEGDWSAASFWLVAGAIAGPVQVQGLDTCSAQGDRQILQALTDSRADFLVEAKQINVCPASLKAFQFDATDCPDLFPPLAILACYAAGTSVITGVSRLAYKESNRALTIQSELRKMGADIILQDDLMIIRGGNPLQGAAISSHNDHRIVMMGAIAALQANGDTVIIGADAVQKSYPHFFKDLQKLGGRIDITG